MVEFITLFLSLTIGPHPVEVAVTDPAVASVELRLNGAVVGVMEGPPWRLECDFGPRPAPHELEAVARDGQDRALGSARQLVNVPRAPIESRVILEHDRSGRPLAARVVWATRDLAEPQHVAVRLDERPLECGPDGRVELPVVDLREPHLLVADVDWGNGRTDQAAAGFGGAMGHQVATELTAVPVQVPDPRAPPSREQLEACLSVRGRPARIAALDRPDPMVILIRSEEAVVDLPYLVSSARYRRILFSTDGQARGLQIHLMSPGPYARRANPNHLLFPISPPTTARLARAAVTVLRVRPAPAEPGVPPLELYADAVGVAGLHVAASGRPRAVVGLFSPYDGDDHSQSTPSGVRAFLDDLMVPFEKLVVGDGPSQWDPARRVQSIRDLTRFERDLERSLECQWVAWIEGRHLPGDIAVGCGLHVGETAAVRHRPSLTQAPSPVAGSSP